MAEPPRNWEFSLSPLVYNIEAGGEIRLSNGAVLRDSAGGGAAMIRGPPVVVDDDRVQLTLIRQEHSGPVAVGGSQTVRIRTAASRSRLFYDDAGGHDLVRVNVTTPYPEAWGRHYESVGFDCSVVDAATPRKLRDGILQRHRRRPRHDRLEPCADLLRVVTWHRRESPRGILLAICKPVSGRRPATRQRRRADSQRGL
ncbi:DUF7289 family protein [Halobellus marinus]|uniref:DUF7289 family protein n=1 Tax=Halobellus marinus TaxID=3075123 RepID=UPI0028A9A557|nr:hypothetical protein [Halobellus sp. DFY28]